MHGQLNVKKSTEGRDNTRKLAEDMVLCYLNSVKVFQFNYMCSKWPPSVWIDSLFRFSLSTETAIFLILLLAHVILCVDGSIL